MIDAVDKVIKMHIQKLLSVKGKAISVFSAMSADQDDQPVTAAGMNKKPDKIEFPFASLSRMPAIDITDSNVTKRIHNYTGYTIIPHTNIRLTYNRCTLHYVVTIFAENRKTSEDLAVNLYAAMRNNCMISAVIQLPIEHPEYKGKYIGAPMHSDIVLGAQIEQVNPQQSDKAQMYKCRISFDVQNVNIYNFTEDASGTYNVIVRSKLSTDSEYKTEEYAYRADDPK